MGWKFYYKQLAQFDRLESFEGRDEWKLLNPCVDGIKNFNEISDDTEGWQAFDNLQNKNIRKGLWKNGKMYNKS